MSSIHPPAVLIVVAMIVSACGARGELIYGVTVEQVLIGWDSSSIKNILFGHAIQGMQPNEIVVGMDVQPSTGDLYVLGSFSRLYRMDPSNGFATPVSGAFAPALNGTHFGFDFDPTNDRIRVDSTTEQNLELNPTTGVVATVGSPLSYAAGDPNFGVVPSVMHAAYSNNVSGAPTTTLYVIDAGTSIGTHTLAIQDPANLGTLHTIGRLETSISEVGGFDISGESGVAYATMHVVGSGLAGFYEINLATGKASLQGLVGGGLIITAMTVAIPEVGSFALMGFAAIGMIADGRRRFRRS